MSPPATSRSAAPARVLVCDGPAHLAIVFDTLCDALDRAGIPWRRHASAPALLTADPEALRRAEVIAAFGNLPVTAAVLDRAPRLRGIVSCVSGTDGYDVPACTARGVLVGHAPTPENARSMAEATMLLLLHLFYDLDGTREDLRAGRPRPAPVRARMLHGRTIGLVGWGRIAMTVAGLLAPFGVTLLVTSRRGTPPDLDPRAQAVTVDELMARSDAVCVLAGAEAGAPPLVGAAQLALMQRSAFLLNLSRGSTVDEDALAAALLQRRIAGAALDVFRAEPLPADSPLRGLPNVILTPHHVGHTHEGDDSLLAAMLDNVLPLLRGEPPRFLRNPQALPAFHARRAAH